MYFNSTINKMKYFDGTTWLTVADQTGTSLTSAHLLVGNASNIATDTAITGDVTISNTGVTTIGVGKVTGSMILDGTITNSDVFANAAIDGSKLVAATASVAGALTATTQAVGGAKDFSTAGNKMKGGVDGTNQTAGYIGEFVVIKFTGSTDTPANGSFGNLAQITLTAGRWFVFGTVQNTAVAGQNEATIALSANSANTTTDHTVGYNQIQGTVANHGAGIVSYSLGPIDQSLTGSITYYIKAKQDAGTFATSLWKGSLYAIRVG